MCIRDRLSALQKSIRGSDPDAAVYYLASILAGGDLVSACRRLLVIASEDVGLAYPQAVSIVKALSLIHICPVAAVANSCAGSMRIIWMTPRSWWRMGW